MAMAIRKRRSERAGRRAKLRSPGRPSVGRRADRRRFWTAIAAGCSSEDAAIGAEVSRPLGHGGFGRRAACHIPSRAGGETAVGRYLTFAEREEIAIWRAQGQGVRAIARRLARAPSTISRELRRNAATRAAAGVPSDDGAVACGRAARRPKPAKLAINEPLRSTCRSGSPVHRRPERRVGPRARGALEGPPARASAAPALGHGVEPGDIARRLRLDFRRCGHADQSRSHLPSAVRARPGRAAPGADRLPAHRAGVAGAAGAQPRTGQALRHPRDPDQPAPGGGGGPRSAGPLGGGCHHGHGQFRHRDPGGAHDAVHAPAPPAAAWRATVSACA